jgi:hypothetical protein
MTEFVCIDGEGMDNEAGEHLYTLLASSTQRYIEDPAGLSTVDCLDFLISQNKPGTTLVGFSVGYDCNMMFRDIDPATLVELWETGECRYLGSDALYILEYRAGKWLNIRRLEELQGVMKVRHAKLWDVFGFFQHSFIKSLDEWLKDADPEILDNITKMKERRGSFSQETPENIRKYCLEECVMLKTLMIRLNDALEGIGIRLKSWHGAAAICKYLYREHSIDHHVKWNEIPELAQQAALCAYYGGRVEIFQQGLIPAPCYDYDRVSSYPSSIINLPSVHNGTWMKCPGGEINVNNENTVYGVWKVSWDIRESERAWLAPFPCRGSDGVIYWPATGQGWYHTPEVQAGLRVFGNRIQVDQGLYMIPQNNRKPFAWMGELLQQRVLWKMQNDPRHIPAKLGLNSGYGVLAQGVNKDGRIPQFQNYFLAGRITSETRAHMFLAASLLPHDQVIAIATDGLFTRSRLPDFECTNAVGGWELSTELTEPAFFAQAGVFFTPSGRHVRTRGFRDHSINYDMCLQEWNENRDFLTWSVPYTERRFCGLGFAASTGHWHEYRRWIDRDRELTLHTEPRKKHVESTEGPYFLMPGDMKVASRPYQMKLSNAEQAKLYADELALFWESVEQEEYNDS